MKKQKIVFTIDIDAFFAQVEENENIYYKNKPLAIAFELNNRGVITTSNYIARKYGIFSGQPIYQAKKLHPNLIIHKPDYQKYIEISEKVFQIINKYTNKIEIASIDECYVDVTNFTNFENSTLYAKKIQYDIYHQLNLTVSIGISDDKILSKIASNFDKPFGISTLFKYEIKEKLWNLPVEKMFFIGIQTALKLKNENINTIGDLAKLEDDFLKYKKLSEQIGINLKKLVLNSKGLSKLEVKNNDYLIKSLSLAKTFPNPISDYFYLKRELKQMVLQISKKLKIRDLSCKTISLQTKDNKKKYVDFNNKSHLIRSVNSKSFTLDEYTNNFEDLFYHFVKLFDIWFKTESKVSYISINVNNFFDNVNRKKQLNLQEYLSSDNNKNKNDNDNQFLTSEKISHIINKINKSFNDNVLVNGEKFKNVKRFNNKKNMYNDSIKFKVWD